MLDFSILFRKRTAIAGSPGLIGHQAIPMLLSAQRNPGEGSLSGLLVRALVAALKGQIQEVWVAPEGVHLLFDSTTTAGSRSQAGYVRGPQTIYVSRTFDDPSHKLTYHIGLIALGEALARAAEAADLLRAYVALLAAGGGRAHTPASLNTNQAYRECFMTAADELYFWLRYQGDPANPAHDRWANDDAVISHDTGRLAPLQSNASWDLAGLFTDPVLLQAHLDHALGRTAPAAAQPSATPVTLTPAPPVVPHPASRFKGWQFPVVLGALARGRHMLFTGPTGSGKTFCFQEAVRVTGQPFELVEGYEGLDDLDFVGAIVPQPPRLEEDGQGNLVVFPESKRWVDGPVARAMRRALELRARVYLFVDELNRIQTRKQAVLTGLLNPVPAAVVQAAGIQPAVDAPAYYVLPIHLTGEHLTVPVEWLSVVGACNVGRQYAVNDIDPALLSRLALKLEFDYLGEDDEVALMAERTGLPAAVALVLVRTAAETRRLCGLGELAGEIDTRALLHWADEILAAGPGRQLDALWQGACITWLAGVAGRDHRGKVLDGNAQAVRDILADRLGVGTTI